MNKKNTRSKAVISWILYDCANSVFYTTIMAGFFPIFFQKYWSDGVDSHVSTQRLGVILSVSGFLLAVLSPLLGVISDKKRYKKKFLVGFMMMGVLLTVGLCFVPAGNWLLAAILYGAGLFCCTASTIFYDSLLISVADSQDYDIVSSKGYAYGYLAGGLLFSLNVFVYLNYEKCGFSTASDAVLFSFLTVAIWWFLFTIPLMLYVQEPQTEDSRDNIVVLLKDSVVELRRTAKKIFTDRNMIFFLMSYWFYIDGVSTVMAMAVDFGVSIKLDSSALIKALLMTQFVGFPSAYIAGRLAEKFGSKSIILLGLVVYILVVFGASQISQEFHFYLMAGMIGLAQGAVQALSRSLFAQLTPAEHAGEYFGFFNLLGKFASVIGPVLVAVSAYLFKDPQVSILSLLILFVLGGALLYQVKAPGKQV